MGDTHPRPLLLKPRHAHAWGHTAIWGRRQENKTHSDEKLTQDQTHHNLVFLAALVSCGAVCSAQHPCSLGFEHSVCTLGITHAIMPHNTCTCCCPKCLCSNLRLLYVMNCRVFLYVHIKCSALVEI